MKGEGSASFMVQQSAETVYLFMLPLEKLTEEAAAGFRENGVDPDSLDLALELDLDTEGNFGESWLGYSKKECAFTSSRYPPTKRPSRNGKRRERPLMIPQKRVRRRRRRCSFPTFSKGAISPLMRCGAWSDAYVDNFVSSTGCLAKSHPHDIEITPSDVHLDH